MKEKLFRKRVAELLSNEGMKRIIIEIFVEKFNKEDNEGKDQMLNAVTIKGLNDNR